MPAPRHAAIPTILLALSILVPACRGPRSTLGPSLDQAPVATPQQLDVWEGDATFARHLARDPASGIYFAGQPSPEAFAEARTHNITTIINLRTPPELERLDFNEPALAREHGLDYISIPIRGTELSAEDADRLATALSKVPATESALIHCGSANRAGALWALYLNRHRDIPIDRAIEEGRAAGLRSDALESRVRNLARTP